ncbi:helix-turn-helix transcriptional regulator [Methylocystis heyeri]|uniref:LuxR family transcriptional regulator n=1 Tax=Methylocystis heyeri TaxID=391905 RepID=A0A6B8KAS4_9HYPH|nr:helix-turn-helix transcriptional regulator [Methylocystis heyeri]QGM44592.1 LuxR family transcriptional regulator [Methylocystis heyeri]
MTLMDLTIQDEIHRLWDELADYGANQSGEAVTRLMQRLCGYGDAWNATWAGAIRLDGDRDDPLGGWRVGAVQALQPIAPHPDEGHFREILRIWDRREIDPSFLLPMRDVGKFRAYSFRRDLPEEWFESSFYRHHYASVGVFDAAFVAFPLNDDSESHFGFYSGRAFTDKEIELFSYALRGIKWFHRHLMLGRGLLVASTTLTAAERRVLNFLLTDTSEKDIGRQLSMASSTVHQYVIQIYRKFGVNSRAGLMSLWLNRAG